MSVGGEVSQGALVSASFQEPSQCKVIYYDGFYVLGEAGVVQDGAEPWH